jgi:Fe-S oxidoreductase
MDTSLRHGPDHPTPDHRTFFDFSADLGVLRAAERCSGAGECLKSSRMGGTMCPSYMVTRNEADSTRGRANLLRQALTRPEGITDPWDSPEVAEVMDLCLSCKGCKTECPSSVDLARLKAEWQQHWHDAHGVPLRSRLIANFAKSMRVAALAPALYNWLVTAPDVSRWLKDFAGFSRRRSLPTLHSTTVRKWFSMHGNRFAPHVGSSLATTFEVGPRADPTKANTPFPHGRVYFFCDESTNTTDAAIGIQAVELLNRLGYEVVIPAPDDSARPQLSKGLVRDAQAIATRNVEALRDLITAETPLLGIEPGALLGFRDEYPDLVPLPLKEPARRLAKNALLIDEFIAREADAGRIRPEQFRPAARAIKLHGHCHQKALASVASTVRMLELPAGHQVEVIPSGCCGMAGAFGYEAEHFDLSQQVGELVLFPAVRAALPETLVAAPGTSCRHQIKDGTGRVALHPVEILHAALL